MSKLNQQGVPITSQNVVVWQRISFLRKPHIYQDAVGPVLVSGCDNWPLRANDKNRLESFDHWFFVPHMTKIKWYVRFSNDSVLRHGFHHFSRSVACSSASMFSADQGRN